ncbi:AarF/UbiB family protein [Fodinibacter luteus]|uniref:AarF/UbiB family protein n=1 Tax=Fodinibacter luteus TaxID=552064 RepID=A0ABP8KDA8_9MICO
MATLTDAASRYARLTALLLRYGRSDLVSGAGLDEFAVADDAPLGEEDKARRFAADLEAMGPTYIKLGQLLSTRFDLLPASYTTALASLQDSVAPIPFDDVKQVIEEDFGVGLRHVFAEFDEEPVAAASLGQVHRAVLPSGREVVVKVQRPDAREVVRADMETMARLAELADRRTDVGRRYGFAKLLAEFRRTLAGELDYLREARNLARFVELTEDYDLITVPEPVVGHCRPRVLTMERIDGRKVTDVSPLGLMDYDTRPIVEQLFQCYLRMMLDKGVLHADPHPGNLMLTTDGRLALLDLGMVVTVPPRLQDRVVKLLLAIMDGDGEEAALVLASMGHPLDGYDAAAFRGDVSHLVSEAVASGSGIQAGTVLVELSRLSGTHGLRPPAEMSMIGKALLNLDQATLHLDPSFEPAEAIRDNVSQILAGGLQVSPGGIVAAAIEAKEFTSQLPKRANRIMDSLAEGEFSIRVQAIDEERLHTVLQRVANRITLGIVIAATVLGASLMMRVPSTTLWFGYPAIAMAFFLFAVVAGVALAVWILLTDRKVAHRPRNDRP